MPEVHPDEPSGLADALRPLMDIQHELVQVYEELCATQIPLADSPGMAEIAGEEPFTNDHWARPVQEAHSYGGLLCFATLDHFGAYTRLLSANPIPFFSSQATARAGIDAASLAYWLNQAGIGIKARVQRGQAVLLGAARQMVRAPAYLPDVRIEGDRLTAGVQDGAAVHGWTTSTNSQLRVGDEVVPRPKAAFSKVLDDPSFAADPLPDVGDGVWWYLSGYTHSGVHVLTQQVEITRAPESSALGMGQGQISVTAEKTLAIAATLGRGVRNAMNEYRKLVNARITNWDAIHRRWSRAVVDLFERLEATPGN